ncbi:putative alkaline phosphatase synthesis transcriptional regulatory protein PhoP [Clostridiales bacterium 1_7_47FAA]|nr:putative alkaline phosphatase synthesis transcriptional regulatory protein PhoP [Clostridiales bacterium 1_7_47FAA]
MPGKADKRRMEKIYIIEDDENIRNLLKIALEGFGYGSEGFETAEEGLKRMKEEQPDMAIFDWMLPGMDGITAIKQVRQTDGLKDIPIMLLTAKEKELDKVIGLDCGADDYMVKPFGVLELSARIRSLLRRTRREESRDVLSYQGISVNRKTREVISSGHPCELTLKEFELLVYLLENQSRVVTRDELLNRIWGYEYDGETRTLDMHIRTLRQKLGDEGGSCIKTVRGVGYRVIKADA